VNFNDKRDNFWEEGQTILELYEVKQVFRTGGMGLVYRVHHKNWNMDLAVKSPRTDYFRTEEQKQNFIKECETWINLGLHPNIVSCYYVRTLGGIPRVFAEYVEGGSLKDWIENKKLYEEGKDKALERILDIAIQFAWGLHYAHEHEEKLVHQDVKPANVMMTEAGEAKVTDFGLAKARAVAGEIINGDLQKSILVSSGGHTPAYCSPEQANKQQLSRKTDIWSWGLSLLEMFAGDVFWRAGQAASEALQSYLETGVEDESIPKMPDVLAELLKQCFQHNPDHRPKDMQEIAGRLKEIYKTNTGQEYLRPEPKPAELLADGLNNKAISMLDLGKKEEAEKLYEEALKANVNHPETIYNRGLLLWRSGRMTDEELVGQLEDIQFNQDENNDANFLLGLVHIERGDADSAVKVLKEAEKHSSNTKNVQQAIKTVELNREKWLTYIRIFEGQTNFRWPIAISTDGNLVASGYSGAYDNLVASSECYKKIWLWNITTMQSIRSFSFEVPHVPIAFSHNDCFLAIGQAHDDCGYTSIDIIEITTGRLFRLGGDRFHVGREAKDLVFSPNENFVLVLSPPKLLERLQLYDILSGKLVSYLKEDSNDSFKKAVFSKDGKTVLVVTTKCVFSWDFKTGKQKTLISDFHSGDLTVFSKDGRLILTANRYKLSDNSFAFDNYFHLWDVNEGKYLHRFCGHRDSIIMAGFSSDSNFILSSSNDNTIRLWETTTGKCLRTFNPDNPRDAYSWHTYNMVFASSENRAISSTGKGTYKWNLNCGSLQPNILCLPQSFTEVDDQIRKYRFFMAEAQSALQSGDNVKAYNAIHKASLLDKYKRKLDLLQLRGIAGMKGRISSFRESFPLKGLAVRGEASTFAISKDTGLMLSGESGELHSRSYLWKVPEGECLWKKEWHGMASGYTPNSYDFSPDGRSALFNDYHNYNLSLINISDGKTLHVFKEIEKIMITTKKMIRSYNLHRVRFSKRGDFAILQSHDDIFYIWNMETYRCVKSFKSPTETKPEYCFPCDFDISADDRFIVFVGKGNIAILQISNGEVLLRKCVSDDFRYKLNNVTISPCGRFFLTSLDNTVQLWNLSDLRFIRSFNGYTSHVTSIDISPDSSFALSGGSDGKIELWEVSSGKCLQTIEGHRGEVNSIKFLSCPGYFISLGSDRALRLWALVWEYSFPELSDWNEGAKPYLETFLTLHSSVTNWLGRWKKPVWDNEDFKKLITELQYRGYGWLRPEGVRKKLEEMTTNWQGPPKMPWESPQEKVSSIEQEEKPSQPVGTLPANEKEGQRFKVLDPKILDPSRRIFKVVPKKPRKIIGPGIFVSQDFLNQLIMEVTADTARYNRVMVAKNNSELAVLMGKEVLAVFKDKSGEAIQCPKCMTKSLASFLERPEGITFHMCFKCDYDDRKASSSDSRPPSINSENIGKPSGDSNQAPYEIKKTNSNKAAQDKAEAFAKEQIMKMMDAQIAGEPIIGIDSLDKEQIAVIMDVAKKMGISKLIQGLLASKHPLSKKLDLRDWMKQGVNVVLCTCGQGNYLTDAFCNQCGKSLTAGALICDKCKMFVPRGQKTCISCGCRVFRFQRSRDLD
jgi:WD40 repeat protein